MYQIRTARGHLLLEVASALQKAIRRQDVRLAGYWAIELFESRFTEYVWRRLRVISAEDCWGIITQEIESLYRCWSMADKHKKGSGRIFLSKAIIILCMAKKSRDADHLTNLLYDAKGLSDEEIEQSLIDSRDEQIEIPQYAYDVHTQKGKKAGKTKLDFFVEEHEALSPRQFGLFDDLVVECKKKRE